MANPSGVIYGVDVSDYQRDADVSAMPVDFVIAKTGQSAGGPYGDTFADSYGHHKANAARGGKIFASYFYLGSARTPQQNVDRHASAEPDRSVPVLLDWEQGSGDASFLRAAVQTFTANGYRVPLIYAPRWYWQSQGSQSLAGLPPLWSSRYPDMVSSDYRQEYLGTPDSYWTGYANLDVRILQYTSVGRVPGYSGNLDCNAFQGSPADLRQLLTGASSPAAPITPTTEGLTDMQRVTLPASMDSTSKRIELPGGPNCRIIIRPRGIGANNRTPDPVFLGHIFAWGDNNVGVGHDPVYAPGYTNRWDSVREWALPGALWADINYSCKNDVDIDIVG